MATKARLSAEGTPMTRRSVLRGATALGLGASLAATRAYAEEDALRMAAARRWVIAEFTPSTLAVDEQMAEMAFFIRAAEPLRGQQVYVVSETLATHEYEARYLARAFREITDISVVQDLIREGELIQRLETQMRTGRNLYDAYVNDSDLIGTHWRYGSAVPLTEWIAGDGAAYTLPTLDLDDFIGLGFTTAPDGKVYQLPDQQFANLYWFRYDWFQRPAIRERFRERHGYELGVPVNWKAYEDIADFFTNDVREIDGVRVWGHMDYGKSDPSLGWRFTDAWLSMAGVGDPGLPNGRPVDEWGIRVEDCHPVGSGISRGGATNAPAAIYALRKYLEWLEKYAPPEAKEMTFSDAGPAPGRGHIAQQIFWYTAFTADLLKSGLPVVNDDGTPKWRMAPSPHGIYWSPGMKLGYQDCGSWTLLPSTPVKRRQAAWLYAQFTTCKTVSLKKTLVGLTPIRKSDIDSQAMTAAASRLGGLVDFYRSPARDAWTPTGTNVPDYPRLAQLWWTRIAAAVHRGAAPQTVMDNLAAAQDEVLARLQGAGLLKHCAPVLNPAIDPQVWLERPGAPKPALADEEGQGETIRYEDLIEGWREGKVT
jgi:glycerol transport system substrate-binding protein